MLLRQELLCAGCKNDSLRDVISGTSIERKPLARIPLRISAYLLDRSAFYGLIIGAAYIKKRIFGTHLASNVFTNSLLLFAVTGFVVYEGLMLARRGQTLGKMVARVRVVRIDGTPLRRWQAWIRAVIRSLCASAWFLAMITRYQDQALLLMALGVADPIVAVFTPGRTAIHDLVARTRVDRVD